MRKPAGQRPSEPAQPAVPAGTAPGNGNGSADPRPYWQRKALIDMTKKEWEQLCDGCGRCCLEKIQEEDETRVHYTTIACRLFDPATCRCTDYPNRARRVSGCVQLTARNIALLAWMPVTCAYRLLAEGQDLPWWHPLVSGRAETVDEAGISVRNRVTPAKREMSAEELEEYIATWPNRVPRRARKGG